LLALKRLKIEGKIKFYIEKRLKCSFHPYVSKSCDFGPLLKKMDILTPNFWFSFD